MIATPPQVESGAFVEDSAAADAQIEENSVPALLEEEVVATATVDASVRIIEPASRVEQKPGQLHERDKNGQAIITSPEILATNLLASLKLPDSTSVETSLSLLEFWFRIEPDVVKNALNSVVDEVRGD